MFNTQSAAFNPLEIKTRLNFVSSTFDDQSLQRTQSASYSGDEIRLPQLNRANFASPSTFESRDFREVAVSAPMSSSFSKVSGYGLVDAAAAVAKSIGRSPFEDVADGYADLGLWGIDAVSAPEVWQKGITGKGVVVAVIDTGVDYTHSDLNNNIWINTGEIYGNGIDDDRNGYADDVIGWDFVDYDNNPMDGKQHGTHVAGTIAGERDGSGVIGVAYDAKIMPIRVLGANGGTDAAIAEGIIYAANNGADVINLSLGKNSPNPEVGKAIRYATERGSVVVMAAGNEGLSAPGYPARYATDWGIAVGAIDSEGYMVETSTWASNWAGTDPNLRYVVAPGLDIQSTVPGGYDSFGGTSMAAPHVAGVVALMLSANPNLTPAQVQQIVIQTAIG